MTKVYGQTMPIRIGGTTEDRATYDPNLDLAVNYTVADFWDAPDTLTYGPPFFQLICKFSTCIVYCNHNTKVNNQICSQLCWRDHAWLVLLCLVLAVRGHHV